MASVTYIAPEDDSPAVTMRGVRFLDGVPVEIEDEAFLMKLRGNQHFDVSEEPETQEEPEEPKPSGAAWQ